MQRHERDLTSLVAGVLFVLIGTAWGVGALDSVRVDGRWLLPALLIGLGAAGLLGSGRRVRHQDEQP